MTATTHQDLRDMAREIIDRLGVADHVETLVEDSADGRPSLLLAVICEHTPADIRLRIARALAAAVGGELRESAYPSGRNDVWADAITDGGARVHVLGILEWGAER